VEKLIGLILLREAMDAAVGNSLVKKPTETPPVVNVAESLSRKAPNAVPTPIVAAWEKDPPKNAVRSSTAQVRDCIFDCFIDKFLWFILIL
jgi:hypothetical protein